MRAYSRGGPTSNRTESHPCLHGMTVPVSPWARASMDDRARASMALASCFICCFAGASQDRAKRVLIERGAEEKRVELYYEGMDTPTSLLVTGPRAKGDALVHIDIGYLEVVESLPKPKPAAKPKSRARPGAASVLFWPGPCNMFSPSPCLHGMGSSVWHEL